MKLDKRFSGASLSTVPARLEEIEENALSYYRGLARLLGGQTIEEEQITWFITGRRSLMRFNGVLRTVVAHPEELGQVVEPILKTFISQNLPFFWVNLGTPGLGDYLNGTGIPFVHVRNMPAMARSLDDLPRTALPAEVEIVRVQTLQDQVDWLNVMMEGFEEPEAARADFQAYLAHSLAEPHPVFEHFLARSQGQPCAISTLLRAEQGAGIYHVTTLPSQRGRGLGNALTLAAMEAARSAGYTEAILFATPSGFPLYQRLGFETVLTGDLFVWNGNE